MNYRFGGPVIAQHRALQPSENEKAQKTGLS
jgi:hypothetical protein